MRRVGNPLSLLKNRQALDDLAIMICFCLAQVPADVINRQV